MQDWMRDVTMDILPEAHHKIAEVIGVEATLKLCEMYGGTVMYVPKTDNVYASVRAQMIRRDYNGYNTSQLARKYGVSTRTVQMTVEDMPVPQIDGQMCLDDYL